MTAGAGGALYSGLFGDAETSALFDDTAEIAAMLQVEGALARVQGGMGVIPAESGAFLDSACRSIRLDPAALAAETGANGVPVPALVKAARAAIGAPEHARWLHWGATSQDIMDTALVLRLRRLLDLWQTRVDALLDGLAGLADTHADLPMAARTYGQAAVPTTFGAAVAGWGGPLLRARGDLPALRARLLVVSLGGAAGTLGAIGPTGPEVRARLAAALDLEDPGGSWHSARDRIAAFAAWATGIAVALGKMGEDMILMAQSGIGELELAGGASSTMPQKANPVGPSVLVALARQVVALQSAIAGAGLHRQQRDGTAWFTEWLTLPALCLSTGRALQLGAELAASVRPVPERMAAALAADGGLIRAEEIAFALAARMPRPDAEAEVKRLVAAVRAGGGDLPRLSRAAHPGLSLPDGPDTGCAPSEARNFAAAVRAGGRPS
ncbi:MAG: lyase family protein [Gemmobacter sp.]